MAEKKMFFSVNARIYDDGKIRCITSYARECYIKPFARVDDNGTCVEIVEWFDSIGESHKRIQELTEAKDIFELLTSCEQLKIAGA